MKRLYVAVMAIFLLTPAARAQDLVLEEVLVTAKKRSTTQFALSQSVRAFSSEELQRLGADSLQDYAEFTPGLTLIDQGPGLTQIVIRGATTGEIPFDRSQIRGTSGYYLDEVPIAVQRFNPNFGLFDMERIEVLRGPQPTLYGSESLTGTIRMITKKPDASAFDGTVEVGSYLTDSADLSWTGRAMLNMPLSDDRAALRVTAYYRDQSGFIDNVVTLEENIEDAKMKGARAALRLTPNDNLTIDASVMFDKMDMDGNQAYREELGHPLTSTTVPEFRDSESLVAALTINYDSSFATFTSVTGYYDKEFLFGVDVGGISDFFTGGDDILGTGFSFSTQEEFTQEFRLVSNNAEGMQWLVGVFYHKQDHYFRQDLPIPGIDAIIGVPSSVFGAPDDNLFHEDIFLDTRQIAVFGELTFPFGEKWELTVGARWFDAKQDSDVDLDGIFAGANLAPQTFEAKEDGINPVFELRYEATENAMIYGRVAKGFRLGGTNETAPAEACAEGLAALGLSGTPESFDADHLWNYELGTKLRFAQGRAALSAAVYLIDWTDAPQSVGLGCGFSFVTNIGELENKGFEADMFVQFSEGWSGTFGFNYMRSELATTTAFTGGVAGDRSPHVPEITYSIIVDYNAPLGDTGYRGFFHATHRYVDERFRSYGEPTAASQILDSYSLTGASIGLTDERWKLEAYVSNIFNEVVEFNKAGQGFAEIPGTAVFTNRPRTFGLRFSYWF